MSDQGMRDILARLDAQEAELAALRAERATRRQRRLQMPGKRKSRLLAVITAAVLVALVPLAIYAANPFTDLEGTVHDPDIDIIYNLGITTGCNPPDLDEYCPTGNVTRQEMASFLKRTASLDRMAYTSLPSASAAENIGATDTRDYMTVTLTVPGQPGGGTFLVRVSFTGYVFARSATAGTATTGCPCLLRGEIRLDGEAASANQIVVREVMGEDGAAVVDPGPAERASFAGSRVFELEPGEYTFHMTLVRETGTAEEVGFGFGNMQAELLPFDGTGTFAVTPGPSPSPSPSPSPEGSPSPSPSPEGSPSPSPSPEGSPSPSPSPGG